MTLRVLSWNLFHGRAVPGAGRDLRGEFAATLAGWDWDVALLQEVPPWWPPALARACDAVPRTALTSRNVCLPAQRALADRLPDVVKSWGGGANAILVRRGAGAGPPRDHRRARVALRPERRVVHGVDLPGAGRVANLHLSTRRTAAREELRTAAALGVLWAGDGPLVLGGDVNHPDPAVRGLEVVARHHVDAVLVRGWRAAAPATTPDRGALSDHRPLLVALEPTG